jgi:hypothetical protein
MKTIHIYFTSGSELMTQVTEEQAEIVIREYVTTGSVCVPHEDKHILIPLSAIERIEIEK